jgi:hypothetical protein
MGTFDSPDKKEDALVPLSKPLTEERIQRDQSSDYAEKILEFLGKACMMHTHMKQKKVPKMTLYEGRIAFLPILFSKSAVKNTIFPYMND